MRQVLYEEGGSGAGLNVYLEGNQLTSGVWANGGTFFSMGPVGKRDVWHHLAVIYRGGMTWISLDGTISGVGMKSSLVLGAHPGDINLGRSGSTRFFDKADDNPGYYFAGRLDDFRILNRALSAEEVKALQQAK